MGKDMLVRWDDEKGSCGWCDGEEGSSRLEEAYNIRLIHRLLYAAISTAKKITPQHPY